MDKFTSTIKSFAIVAFVLVNKALFFLLFLQWVCVLALGVVVAFLSMGLGAALLTFVFQVPAPYFLSRFIGLNLGISHWWVMALMAFIFISEVVLMFSVAYVGSLICDEEGGAVESDF